jgi:hypothetical protein
MRGTVLNVHDAYIVTKLIKKFLAQTKVVEVFTFFAVAWLQKHSSTYFFFFSKIPDPVDVRKN